MVSESPLAIVKSARNMNHAIRSGLSTRSNFVTLTRPLVHQYHIVDVLLTVGAGDSEDGGLSTSLHWEITEPTTKYDCQEWNRLVEFYRIFHC